MTHTLEYFAANKLTPSLFTNVCKIAPFSLFHTGEMFYFLVGVKLMKINNFNAIDYTSVY